MKRGSSKEHKATSYRDDRTYLVKMITRRINPTNLWKIVNRFHTHASRIAILRVFFDAIDYDTYL